VIRRFADILKESSESPKFRRDNPGGDWLKYKQEAADADMRKGRSGHRGATTGYFNKNLHLPVSKLHKLRGAMGEHKFRHEGPKAERLAKEIGHPKNFNSKDHPIMIGVNHHGEPHVMEGNHRLAYAHKHGISHIHAEVKYYNGGEDHPHLGDFHPHELLKHHKDD
jgi:hypothetical protein